MKHLWKVRKYTYGIEIPEGILFDEISGFSPKIINGNLDLLK